MGSSLTMKHWLQQWTDASRTVDILLPTAYPTFLGWMPGAADDLVAEHAEQDALRRLDEADLIVCTDFGEAKRVGVLTDGLTACLERGVPCLVVDHHLHPDLQATVLVSHPEASSASELVYRLIRQMSEVDSSLPKMSFEAATCTYTGIMTDTGNFQFSSSDPELYELVADLIRAGVRKDEIYDNVFNQYSVDRMRLTGYCLGQKMRILDLPNTDVKVALIALNKRDLFRFNFQSGDAEGIVNMPLQIGPVKYSCLMREDKDKIKISLRSQGNRPVNIFAHEVFNGGGHMNASGGDYKGTVDEAVAAFVDSYKKFLV